MHCRWGDDGRSLGDGAPSNSAGGGNVVPSCHRVTPVGGVSCALNIKFALRAGLVHKKGVGGLRPPDAQPGNGPQIWLKGLAGVGDAARLLLGLVNLRSEDAQLSHAVLADQVVGRGSFEETVRIGGGRKPPLRRGFRQGHTIVVGRRHGEVEELIAVDQKITDVDPVTVGRAGDRTGSSGIRLQGRSRIVAGSAGSQL